MKRTIFAVFLMAMPPGVVAMTQTDVPKHAENLPKEVRRLLERYEVCVHFAGEFNGDGLERDREVNATMKELRCGKVEKDGATLRRKYARHPDALKALDALNGF